MPTEDPYRDRYEEARRRFKELDVEAQASFLVEATASTLAKGLEQAGHVLADTLGDMIREVQCRPGRSASGAQRPGAAEPETAQRRAARNGDASES